MRPNLTDYQNRTKAEIEQSSRLVSWVVLGLATSGFIALAWYAYQSGSESVITQEIATIEADASPIKVRPDDAGGEEFPHQDKTIYDVIDTRDEPVRVEKLLPEPEEPIIPTVKEVVQAQQQEAQMGASTWVSEKLRTPSQPTNEPQLGDTKEVAQEEAPEPVEVAQPAKETKSAEPEPVKEAAQVTQDAPKEAAPEPKQAEAPKKSGAYKMQLGAFGSEEEAEANWIRIRGQHAALLADQPHVVVRADLPNGTFYRLRVGGYESPDAVKAACSALSARGQGCFYAGK